MVAVVSKHLQGVTRSLTDVPAQRQETVVCPGSVGEAVKASPKSVVRSGSLLVYVPTRSAVNLVRPALQRH